TVKACCVISCHNQHRRGNRISNGLRFFCFPAWKQHLGSQVSELTRRRCMTWVAAVRRKTITFNNISRNTLVCSQHFHKVSKPAYEMLECDPDWVPSLHLGHTEVKATLPGRFNRSTRRLQSVTGDHAAPAPLDVAGQRLMDEAATADDASQMDDGDSSYNTAEQQECHLCSCRCAEINCLLEENRRLKEELAQKKMDEDYFKDDDAKVKYYTGLPCLALLMGVLKQLLPCLPQTGRKLSPFQMLLSTLMHTIGTMFKHLKPSVHWPERHCMQATMPHQFVEAFGNRVAVIVDCLGICIERASNLKARAQTFSHYKHQHTLKYLLGITPRGSIFFISQGWGGCVSDKHVTENSGLLNKLLPGDLVLHWSNFILHYFLTVTAISTAFLDFLTSIPQTYRSGHKGDCYMMSLSQQCKQIAMQPLLI
uniref:Si:dkey-20i10.7 n=1 Tax=Sinocyclocheilus grahami TaxID=75366 RepID=A0A672NPU3_SINGR